MSESAPNPETQAGDELLAELADDFLRRFRAGERPSVDEYAGKHSELADRIRDVFPAMLAMELPGVGATHDFAPLTERVGATIGRYKLLERIGEGVFGVVYMAEQQHPVRRKVALKVIRPGFDTRQVIARFEAERQALALMDHENIARVLDAGATDSGHPYFVMELVRGVPITEFCDRNEIPPRERLELFVQVCRAVQHAHTKGIIHRDIKPTNVLVTLQDGVPVPKVIDFGVAKATGQQLTEKTLFTNFAQMVGTPLYMSPEQAEMTSVDVDTRSDVYSLGVLLYELLTGTTPLDKERLKRAAFDEVRRIIREDEPPRPSTRLSSMGEQARSISAQRKSDPRHLGQLVRGELDWIVMKALEKERARRYETPIGLARDVERYLRNEPVEACPPSAWYRFRKFARRQKALVAALAGVALFVIAGAGILAVSNVRVSRSLERERRNSYGERIALANREWSANNLSRMEELLDDCPKDLRGWEWHYLKRLPYSPSRPLQHDSPVISVAFSPHGKHLACGAQSGIVTIWNKNGEQLKSWQAHPQNTQCVVYSPDGRYFVTASYDGKIKIWEAAAILRRGTIDPVKQLEFIPRVWSITFSSDGERLAAAAGRTTDSTGEVRVWKLKSSEAPLSLSFSDRVTSVQFSPDGESLAIGGAESVGLWDAETGQKLMTFSGHELNNQRWLLVPMAANSPRSQVSSTFIQDRAVKVWDAHTGEAVHTLRGHVGGLRAVSYSPDGQRLVSAGLDQTVKVWDAVTGREVLTLRGHLDNIFSVAFSPDGNRLASASLDKSVRIWDATPLEHEVPPEHVTYRGHGGAAVTDVDFHPNDGRSIVSASTDGTIHVWDFKSGQELTTLQELPSQIRLRVAYSPDGQRLAAASTAEKLRPVNVWQIAAKEKICSYLGHRESVLSLAFSPDGRHVASADFGFMIRVWNATTAEELRTLKGHTWPIHEVAFSPDGKLLASASADSTVRVWDWSTGQELRVLAPRHTARVNSVALSRDGRVLASGSWDRSIKVWDVATWELQQNLADPTGGVLCLAFGDDRRLAWGSSDSTVKVWDGPGTETHVLSGHTSWVQAVTISPDGKWIASASLDGTVKIWPSPPNAKTQDPESVEGD